MKDKKITVWINPDEYKTFLSFLGEHGFHWQSGVLAGSGETIYEQCHDERYATTYTLDLSANRVSYFPLELYDKDSPTRDDEKFNYLKSQMLSCDEAVEKIHQFQ